jgi:hypothetical protein
MPNVEHADKFNELENKRKNRLGRFWNFWYVPYMILVILFLPVIVIYYVLQYFGVVK